MVHYVLCLLRSEAEIKCDMTPGKYICDTVSAAQEYLLMPGCVKFLGMLNNADTNGEKEYSLLEEAGVETFL